MELGIPVRMVIMAASSAVQLKHFAPFVGNTTFRQQTCQLSNPSARVQTYFLLLGMMKRLLHSIVIGRRMRRPRRSGSEYTRVSRL
jgi:hypothetical protein